MKKSLIALAVASAVAAPAFAATSNVDIYGIMNVAIEDQDVNNDMNVVDNASRIGFKGTEDLGGGLKAIWQIESQVSANANGGVGANTIGGRNTFVGLSGGFGTVLMGRHDTPYKMSTGSMDLFADTIGDYEDDRLNLGAGLNDAHDARSSNAIAYVSPTVSGFHAAVAVVSQVNAAGKDVDATSFAGVYANGPLTVAVGYQDVDGASTGGFSAGTALNAAIVGNDSDAWKIGASYKFGDITVNAIYENADVDTVGDVDSYVLGAAYAMGPITLKAQYHASEFPGAIGDADMWAIGADYSLSKRTSAYFVYASGDSDLTVDNDGFNIGLKHTF